ncbi:MAG: hypothetical protein WAT23_08205 [Chromatiaceae bacterium]
MSLPDPYAYLQEVARRLPTLTRRDEIDALLDDVEYLFEVIPPELQDPAYAIIDQLRAKREAATS